jgi:cytochrome c-type biogenesis protein CcmI
MPDPWELAVLAVLIATAGVAVAWPLLRSAAAPPLPGERETMELRHRVALDGLRDVEADRRAGSLDEAAYASARAEAEARAAATLRDLDRAAEAPTPAASSRAGARRPLLVAGAIIGLLVVGGALLPPPLGLANPTLNPRAERLADAAARFAADQRDAQAISDLADAYAEGDTLPDQQRAAAALLLLINLQPRNASAYARLATAYLRAGDFTDATATLDRLAEVSPASTDLPFLRGLVARARGDAAEARTQFERFLALAPNDPRAAMIRGLLAEGTPNPSP